MRESSLRWGLGLGIIAAIIGIAVQFVAAHFAPTGRGATFDVAIRYLVVAAPLVLLAVGLAVGLAYFAGLQAERDRPQEPPRSLDAVPPWGGERRDSALAGTIVMASYWVLTSLFSLVVSQGTVGGVGGFLSGHALQGVLLLAFGYGMGALGGRAPAARKLLDSLVVAPGEVARADNSSVESEAGVGGDPAPAADDAR
jgi:hypothetical protein